MRWSAWPRPNEPRSTSSGWLREKKKGLGNEVALDGRLLIQDVLVKVLRCALERGDDIADVNLLAHAGFSGDRLQRALEPSHHFARPIPAAGRVKKLTKVRSFALVLIA